MSLPGFIFFCEHGGNCKWQGFALHKGLGWGKIPKGTDWHQWHVRECGGTLAEVQISAAQAGTREAPAPSLGVAYDGAPMDLAWFIRSLEHIARPVGPNETGILRLEALRDFITALKMRQRAEARSAPDSPRGSNPSKSPEIKGGGAPGGDHAAT
jgi:hypothetical protein